MKGGRANGGDHKFLEIRPLPISVNAAVQDVEKGDGQNVGAYASQVTIERQASRVGAGPRYSQADPQQSVSA